MTNKINQTLAELIAGILCSGAVIWLGSLLILGIHLKFAFIFWIGVATAIGLSVHMYRSIDRALDMDPDSASKYMRKAYITRTMIIIAVGLVVVRIDSNNIVAMFIGILCLKFGAFLQPVIHRYFGKDETPSGAAELPEESEMTDLQNGQEEKE